MQRRALTWSEAILAGSLAFLAYALVSTRRWMDREHRELRKTWIEAVPTRDLRGSGEVR